MEDNDQSKSVLTIDGDLLKTATEGVHTRVDGPTTSAPPKTTGNSG